MGYRATLTRRRLWGLLPPFTLTTNRNATAAQAVADLKRMYQTYTAHPLRLRSKGDTITVTEDRM